MWSVVFIIADILASTHHHTKPRSFSEFLWKLFPKRWRRAILIGILTALFVHLASGPDVQVTYVNW